MDTKRWTIHDLERLPDDETKRYEIIDGELYVSTAPSYEHQSVCFNVGLLLGNWCTQTHAGRVRHTLGIIFADDDNVIPDLVWISQERLAKALRDGKLYIAPELVMEVLSPGSENTYRDRDAKLKLYSRRGVDEYWTVNWQTRRVEVYRHQNDILRLASILNENDTMESPLLPGFRCQISEFFVELDF